MSELTRPELVLLIDSLDLADWRTAAASYLRQKLLDEIRRRDEETLRR